MRLDPHSQLSRVPEVLLWLSSPPTDGPSLTTGQGGHELLGYLGCARTFLSMMGSLVDASSKSFKTTVAST